MNDHIHSRRVGYDILHFFFSKLCNRFISRNFRKFRLNLGNYNKFVEGKCFSGTGLLLSSKNLIDKFKVSTKNFKFHVFLENHKFQISSFLLF